MGHAKSSDSCMNLVRPKY